MFIVLLRFKSSEGKTSELMQSHNEWVRRGLQDGVFLLVGSLRPSLGGAILAHASSLEQLQTRVGADPLVAAGVVEAEILEVTPSAADERLRFLLG